MSSKWACTHAVPDENCPPCVISVLADELGDVRADLDAARADCDRYKGLFEAACTTIRGQRYEIDAVTKERDAARREIGRLLELKQFIVVEESDTTVWCRACGVLAGFEEGRDSLGWHLEGCEYAAVITAPGQPASEAAGDGQGYR